MLVDIRDKVVVITGSSRGIGKELALSLSKENVKVVINYCQNEVEAQKTYSEVKQYCKDCILIKADVTKQEDVRALYQKTLDYYGKIDALVNNAGLCNDNLFPFMKSEQWHNVLNVNLTGAYYCCKYFSKYMIYKKQGKIINIASIKGQEGTERQINYSASKGGLIALTKALAKELGDYNILVNAVCPGFIETDLNRHNKNKKSIAETRSALAIDTALQDYLAFMKFFLSDNVSGISGRVFNLDSRIL